MTDYGLVLGGGGARALTHIGVWRVLEEAGLPPQVLAGTSMGGLVAAFIAAGVGAQDLRRVVEDVSWLRLNLRPGRGLLDTSAFERGLARYLPPTFEELERPLAVTATDILTGRQVYLASGDLYPALRATTAFPGAIDPVPHGDMLLADGGILNQVPVDAALFLGVHRVVAVGVTVPEPLEAPERRRWRPGVHLGTVQALRRAAEIMQAQLTEARLGFYRPDVLLRPRLEGMDITSFRRSAEALEAGEAAARADLERVRALVEG